MTEKDVEPEVLINRINHPKNIRRINLTKKPCKQKWYPLLIADLIVKMTMKGLTLKVTKTNMEEIDASKEPYLHLLTHNQFLDFIITQQIYRNKHIQYAVNMADFDRLKGFLLRQAGCFPARRVVGGAQNVKNVMHIIQKNKRPAGMYPEIRYCTYGKTLTMPINAYGKLAKLLKVPVVSQIMHGNYLACPEWMELKWKKKGNNKEVPIHARVTRILTKEDVQTKSVEELDKIIRDSLQHNEYKYWQETGFKITDPNRAHGIHRVLYRCPHCKVDFKTTSILSTLTCTACGVAYELGVDGFLRCTTGQKTIFSQVPDWAEWQREEVRKEIVAGTYFFEEEMEAASLVHPHKFRRIGKVKFRHDMNGIRVEGHYRGKDYVLTRAPHEMYTLIVSYFTLGAKKNHIIEFCTPDDSFNFIPKNEQVEQKLCFAVEEMYKIATKQK
ncbi:MAG: 1-acyl-sn-glycerol-3-phosphate acyltransferase [Firmicutes bacterium]|nr:1-acyl-sn-glycerol-3-phosphate acyltransferase [Bacillota bacterium]